MKAKANLPKQAPAKKRSIPKKLQETPVPKQQSFFEDVWDVVRQVPKGRVTSYGAIANYLGTKMSARMVGWAMAAAPHSDPPVPAQRVLNRNGMLTGRQHFSPPGSMEQLLQKDGLKVENDTVVDFGKYFWDPAVELGI